MASIDDTWRRITSVTRAKQQGVMWRGHCPAHDDKTPSLSIGRGKDGHIWLKCHTGCSTASICEGCGLKQTDLYPSKKEDKPQYVDHEFFDYRDERGKLLFQVIRGRLADPFRWPKADLKEVKQRRPDGNGGFVNNTRGVRRVLYRLPELLKSKGSTVWVAEGEKCVECLREMGLVATCNPMGAGCWDAEYSKFLEGREVVILPDNDAAGVAHAISVATKTYGIASKIQMLELWRSWPAMPEKGDVYDWAQAGHSVEELCTLAEALPLWTPSASVHAPRGNGRAEGAAIETALSKIVTARSILATDYPEPRWAVKGMIPEGTTIIAGPPKLGKSVFCLNLAVSVSEGGKALSYFDTEQGAVLYLALEDSERRIKARLQKLLTKAISEQLEIVTRWPRLNEGGLEAIGAWILRHGASARLIIVDTFKRIRPLKSSHHKNASTYDVDYDDVVPLTDLTISNSVALTLVAHTRKAEADDALAMISGSYGLTGAADGALILARKRNSRTATLSVIGRDVEEQELALEFEAEYFMWKALGKSTEVMQSNERSEILELLKNSDEPLSPIEIAGALDRTSNAIRFLLWKMKSQGQITDFGRKYQLPGYVPPMKRVQKKRKRERDNGIAVDDTPVDE